MKPGGLIRIWCDGRGWQADFSESVYIATIGDLFGGSVLPLPWTEKAAPVEVLRDVEARHPLADVVLRRAPVASVAVNGLERSRVLLFDEEALP